MRCRTVSLRIAARTSAFDHGDLRQRQMPRSSRLHSLHVQGEHYRGNVSRRSNWRRLGAATLNGRPALIVMPTFRAVYLNNDGEEEYRDIVADSEGEAIRKAKRLNVPVVLERDGRVIVELQPSVFRKLFCWCSPYSRPGTLGSLTSWSSRSRKRRRAAPVLSMIAVHSLAMQRATSRKRGSIPLFPKLNYSQG